HLTSHYADNPVEKHHQADRIARRESERVADRSVGRLAAPLHEDVVRAAVLDDVPHDQEVAREVEAPDDVELVGYLTARAGDERSRAVARAHATLHQLAQVLERRLAGRQREIREAVPEVLQR